MKYLPRKVEGEPLDWDYDGEFERYVTAVDVENMIKYGCEIEIIEGWY